MPLRRRTLTEMDRSDWANFARFVVPLPGRALPDPQPAAGPSLPLPMPPQRPPMPRPSIELPPALTIGAQPAGLDSGTWNRFRSGRIAPTRTLDLHGRSAQRAFHALHTFLHAAHADRLRCVEVITGRGSGEAGGVLRRELPLWLNLPALRPLVLAAAHPHAANPGAVRLLLRRPR
jgi:DNA-nicking Smr family endonuclease